jgi:hypothetical protein
MLLRRHGNPPPPSEALLNEGRSVVRKLWRRVQRDGAQISAVLWWDNSLSEACVEITVRASHAEDFLAESLAKGILAALDAEGAREPTAEEMLE